jgi:NADH:ubiquinone oxidoreductase subunit F (NADH-binding)
VTSTHWLLPAQPHASLADYVAAGGGEGLRIAGERGTDWVLDELQRSGLRGRGGAGFTTAQKWRSVLSGGEVLGNRYVVANGAEGEPGTFKDRPLMRANPYQVIEGLVIAAIAIRATEAFIAIKDSFQREAAALERAAAEMEDAGMFCDCPVTLVGGPEEYLFGEEKALLEVIEGNDPMPRWLPPYLHGLFATTPQEGWSGSSAPPETQPSAGSNPTLVNNVETLAHVPLVLRLGAARYCEIGTSETPGPLLCTVTGDVAHPGVGEIHPGVSLRDVIDHLGGGPRAGHSIRAILSGVANPVLTSANLDTPVSYEGFRAAGSGLGSVGFIVYDDTRSMLAVAQMVSRFLYVESCGQCRACKYGCGEITRRLDTIAGNGGTTLDIEVIGERLLEVTDQNRCFLGAQEQRVVSSLLRAFPEDFVAEMESGGAVEPITVPKIVDIVDGQVIYDERQSQKQPDWTYVSEGVTPGR